MVRIWIDMKKGDHMNKIITIVLRYPNLLKNRPDSDTLIEAYNNILTINPITVSGLVPGLVSDWCGEDTQLEYMYTYEGDTPIINKSHVPLDEPAYVLHKTISCSKLSYIKNKPIESSVMIPKLTGTVLYLEVCPGTDMVVSVLLGNNLLLSRWDTYRINNISVLCVDVELNNAIINLDVGNSIYKYSKDNKSGNRELTRSQIEQLQNGVLNILALAGTCL